MGSGLAKTFVEVKAPRSFIESRQKSRPITDNDGVS
uniref:Uncharacterized protein n=1 Tax=Medicago truncatula TaxID=3880 RepID=A2Q3K7_MEDTR|nr:hypothetical protein MtrDRAFT_AC155885g10v2 [Medicago truncatula]